MCGLILLQTSCSSLVASIGPDLGQYSDNRIHTRPEVIRQLGEPAKSIRLRKVTTVAALRKLGDPAVEGCVSKSARVSRIDEYVLRGPIENYKDVWTMRSLAIVTLGASELVFLPVSIYFATTSLGDTRRLYMVYDPSDVLVAHRTGG